MSHNLNSRTFHSVIDFYVALRRAEVPVPSKLHDDLGRNAAVGELGDNAAPRARHLPPEEVGSPSILICEPSW